MVKGECVVVDSVAFGGQTLISALRQATATFSAAVDKLATDPAFLSALKQAPIAGDQLITAGGAPSTLALDDKTTIPGNSVPPATNSAPSTSVPPVASGDPGTSVPPEPPAGGKVFVVGNKRRFGGKFVKVGLKAMLDAADGKRGKGRTHNTLSNEDAGKLRAILASDDPEVQKLLNSRVPNGKSLVIDENGKLVNTVDTKAQVMAEKTLQMQKHGMFWERSAGGQLQVGDKKYDVAGTELHSPIKIALDGQDARLDSQHGFRIDLDGFGKGKGAVGTSGGLNSNEAWLVRDKDADGISRGGVVDGRDVYGDHEGRFGNGYEELARDFASEIKIDPVTGSRYLDLSDPDSRAAKELKLLDANGRTVPASQLVGRLDVDFANVHESDTSGSNQIRQRAEVTFRDGHKATSADQWYKTA